VLTSGRESRTHPFRRGRGKGWGTLFVDNTGFSPSPVSPSTVMVVFHVKEEFMRLTLAVGIVLGGGLFLAASAGSRTLYSYTEASGNQHPQSTGTTGVVTITCTNVAGTNATCFVTGSGLGQQVPKGQNVSTTGPGTVTLVCNGSGALRCWARVDGPVAAQTKKKTNDQQ
jgi:hypothetical protein